MKKSIIAVLLFMVAVTASANVAGQYKSNYRGDRGVKREKPVGAPLDGGLLMLLGGTGVIYYAARKHRVSKEI